MPASLALRHGVVWICRTAGGTRLVPYDLGGRRLGRGFRITGAGDRRAEVRGIAVDEDRRIWAADAGAGTVRAFTAFGLECAGIPALGGQESFADAAGIAVRGAETELRILVSARGERRHALVLLDPRSGSARSLRPGGDPAGTFANLAGVALAGRLAFACEAGRGVVQVFRDEDFHYGIACRTDGGGGRAFAPRAIAATSDGRSVVAGHDDAEGFLLLFDAGGRRVRRLDEDLARGDDALEDDVCGVVVHEGATERDSLVLALDRGGDRALAFSFDGRSLGRFHELDVADAASGTAERERTAAVPPPLRRERPS